MFGDLFWFGLDAAPLVCRVPQSTAAGCRTVLLPMSLARARQKARALCHLKKEASNDFYVHARKGHW